MYYGLHFISDAKVPVQVRVDSTTLRVYARTAPKGQWGAWRRLDVERRADGTLQETAYESLHAQTADAAGRMRTPVRITFGGSVSGEMLFDGSTDMVCNLTHTLDGYIRDIVNGAVQAHVREYHPKEDNPWGGE